LGHGFRLHPDADRERPHDLGCRARLAEALEGGVRHIGFKDVGLPLPELRALADAIRMAGGRSYLEVVSLDAESEMASARAAVDLDVDVLLGGTRAEAVTAITRHHPVRYYPFPGRITGHPSVLEGPEADIVASARALAELEHVHGLDLLAYRYTGDVPQLMASVSAAVAKPVIVAGSIDSAGQAAIGSISSGPVARLEFTRGSTRQRWYRPSGAARISSAAPLPSSPSHFAQSPGARLTGSRWCVCAIQGEAAQVTTATVTRGLSPFSQACQMPAKTSGAPSVGVKYHGRRLSSASLVHS
jgi:hypothetical protein